MFISRRASSPARRSNSCGDSSLSIEEPPSSPLPYRISIDSDNRPTEFWPAHPIIAKVRIAKTVEVSEEVFHEVRKNRTTRQWDGSKFVPCEFSEFTNAGHLLTRQKSVFALGRFDLIYAIVETELHLLMVEKSGLTKTKGKAVFGGVRVKAAMDNIKRLCIAMGEAPCPYLERAFKQLGIINDFRSTILHYGAGNTTSNEVRAFEPAQLKEFPVSAEILVDMCIDLQTIRYLLRAHTGKVWAALSPFDAPRQLVMAHVDDPFRYSQPQLDVLSHTYRRISKTLPPRPHASPASQPPAKGPRPLKLSSAQKRALRDKGTLP